MVYFESPNLEGDKALILSGYLIQTEEQGSRRIGMDAVAVYKELSEVERAFRRLKDVIEVGPLYHPPQSL